MGFLITDTAEQIHRHIQDTDIHGHTYTDTRTDTHGDMQRHIQHTYTQIHRGYSYTCIL